MCVLARAGRSLPLHFIDHWGDTAPGRSADFIASFLENNCSHGSVRSGGLSQFINQQHGGVTDTAFGARV